ncbi:hypothetical protein [Winogradskyella sp. Asnod2-B02-A]|uniref:hypothetical protein n=1 Tax=Winogradskyella sp. Asnod2-B02-A TaxID=3160583 RepID=UPI00386E61C2
MGHHISAIIGKDTIDKEKIKEFGLAVAFENGYAIVLLDFYAMCELAELLDKSTDSDSENIDWDCKLTYFIAKEIGLENFALIQTDYFAGIGDQYASYFEKSIKIINEVSINEVLNRLGVEKKNELDEFDTINLTEYRNTEFYYKKNNNWADKRDNMIAGRILNN